MKALFITHTTDTVYGAPKSLQQILKNVDFEYDFIYPHFPVRPTDISIMREYVGKNCRNIYSKYLPYREEVMFPECNNIHALIYRFFLRLREPFDRIWIRQLIKREKYDYVFLNSSTLFPLISNRYKTVIFIREWLRGRQKSVMQIHRSLKKAHKIILIDASIRAYLDNDIKDFRIIANPVDMEKVNSLDANVCARKLGIDIAGKIIVSMIGMVYAEKGSGFIIDTFQDIQRKDVLLLIVGNNQGEYARRYMEETRDNPYIIWTGEQKEIDQIYKISDYIIRGEDCFGIGRTVYEGLYAGCSVILQGDREQNLAEVDNYQEFEENILFYKPRNREDLLKVFEELCKKPKRKAKSTSKEYIRKLMAYIKGDSK